MQFQTSTSLADNQQEFSNAVNTLMEPHKYFGLHAPPFDGRPDPRFYHPTASHAESLATLQYATHAGKACTLVLGDSGSGKTLLGRMLARAASTKARVLWVHGIGQPRSGTEVTICRARAAGGRSLPAQRRNQESTLSYWTKSGLPSSQPTVLVVDNADGLRPNNWEDVIALTTREIRAPRPVSVFLFGLPELLDLLAMPEYARLQRRVFRTCRLNPLLRDEVRAYIVHRLRVVGGSGETFTPAAIELIHRFSAGNPALINHLCENAMVEAFAHDRKLIDGPHVVSTVHAITGGTARPSRALPAGTPAARSAPLGLPAVEQRGSSRVRSLASRIRPAALPPAPATLPPRPATARTAVIPEVDTCDDIPDFGPLPLDERLRALESRLSEALSRVRQARYRPGSTDPLPPEVVELCGADPSAPAGPSDANPVDQDA